MNRSRSAGLALSFIAIFSLAARAADPGPATAPASPDQQQMENWWADLAKPEPRASRALLNFSATPQQTVLFLKTKLKPLTITREEVSELLEELGSDDDKSWKAAAVQLDYFDPRLVINLESLMDMATPPAKQRLVELLSDRPSGSLSAMKIVLRKVGNDGEFNFYADNYGSWWAEAKVARLTDKTSWTRAVRGIVLLEHIGTPDAIAIIKDMAGGHPDAQPTKVAKEALAAH